MKVFGVLAVLLGLSVLIFAAMAYSELQTAATSETAPSADSMPLTKIVGPELFDSGNAETKPGALARTTFNRIYVIGGGGILLGIVGLLILAAPRARGTKQNQVVR